MTAITDYYGSLGLYSTKEYNNQNTTGNDFNYDKNGNMIADLDRKIVTIRYNILNLPDTIQFKTGNQIINRYDASGRKLSTRYFTLATPIVVPIGNTKQWEYDPDIIDETGTFYVDNKEYGFNGCDQGIYWLDQLYNTEGYADYYYGGFTSYNYYRRDHLGNNREVWNASNNTTAQRTQYYPSGLPWASNSGDNPSIQNRKYNGKEFVEMHGYDTYDIVWRQYNPAIGRFQTPDPELEKTYAESPYTMCNNNMINRTDPDGRFAFLIPFIPVAAPVVSAAVVDAVVVTGAFVSAYLAGKALRNVTDSYRDNAKASTPEGIKNQRNNEKHETEKQNRTDIEMKKNIDNNIGKASPDGNSNSKGDPNKRLKTGGKIGIGIGIGVIVGMQISNPNASKDANEAHVEKAKKTLNPQPKPNPQSKPKQELKQQPSH